MKKSIIYTDTAQKKLDKILIEFKNKIEEDIRLSKNYPGEELIEITASDVEETSERFYLEEKNSKIAAKNRLLKRILPIYVILGVFLMLFGLFYSEVNDLLLNEPNRLIYVLIGFILVLVGVAYYYSILQKESESKKDSILTNIAREREIDIQSQNIEILRKLTQENQSVIKSHIDTNKKDILENKLILAKMSCQSIDPKSYRDINLESYNLNKLLELSIQFSEVTGSKRELKESLTHIYEYFKRYPESINRDDYVVTSIRNIVEPIIENDLIDLKELILQLMRKSGLE